MITVLLVATSLANSSPCLTPLASSEVLFAPRDGSVDVPTNANIILVNTLVSDATLSNDDGPIEFDVSVHAVDIGFSSPFDAFVLEPRDPFVAGQTITVKTGDSIVGTFVVGDAADFGAPDAPSVTLVGAYSDGACPPYVELTIEGGADMAFATAALGDATATDTAGMSVGSQLIVAGPANETAAISVRTVDLAGNTSEPTVVDATFPAAFSPGWGCSSNTGAGAPTFFALLLLGLGLRRRQR